MASVIILQMIIQMAFATIAMNTTNLRILIVDGKMAAGRGIMGGVAETTMEIIAKKNHRPK